MQIRRGFFVIGTIAIAAAVYAAQQSSVLVMDGRTVSSNLRAIDGTVYVPVRDLAAAYGYEVKESSGQMTLERPSTSIGSPMTFSSLGTMAPAKPRAMISANSGEEVPYSDFGHRLIGIDYPAGDYRQQFDARRQKLRPAYREERLVVLKMSATNHGADPASAPVPSTLSATAFDTQGVGYPVSAVDYRSGGGVQSDDPMRPTELYNGTPLRLANGATLDYALIASIPKDREIKRVVVEFPARSDGNTSGATIAFNLTP